jgi:hypothetical protein
MRFAWVLAAVLAIAACETGPPATASPAATVAPSPSPATGPWAVMVHRAGEGEPYFVQLVDRYGRGGPSVDPVTRSAKVFYFPPTPCPPRAICPGAETANYKLPETSISTTHVYFLDGDTVIRSLAPDGTVKVVKTVHSPANSQVVFSVSPDDRRIAVSIITLATVQSPAPLDVHMYVEDLVGSSNRVDLYSSTTLAEWPIGWHAGNLVVAVGSADIGTYDNPYAATAYHVSDPATGLRLATLTCTRGLLVAAGTACADGWCATASGPCVDGTVGKQSWDGTKALFTLPSGPPPRIFMAFDSAAFLSPDGTRLAAAVVSDPQTGSLQTMLLKNGTAQLISPGFVPMGWFDGGHLILGSAFDVEIIDVVTQAVSRGSGIRAIPTQGRPAFTGMLPADLG